MSLESPRKYHVTNDGPKRCRAKEGNCPIGGEHGSYAETQKIYENEQAKERALATLNRKAVNAERARRLEPVLEQLQKGDWVSAEKTYYSITGSRDLGDISPEALEIEVSKEIAHLRAE